MKDEKQYKWVDVTEECTITLERLGKFYGIKITHPDADNSFSISSGWETKPRSYCDIRIVPWSTCQAFRIERRVEVEQPEMVTIQTKDRDGGVLGTRRISYQSAKELGLIKWVPQVGDRVHGGSGAQGVIVYIAESGSDPIVVRLDKIDAYATYEYEASELTLIEAAPK